MAEWLFFSVMAMAISVSVSEYMAYLWLSVAQCVASNAINVSQRNGVIERNGINGNGVMANACINKVAPGVSS